MAAERYLEGLQVNRGSEGLGDKFSRFSDALGRLFSIPSKFTHGLRVIPDLESSQLGTPADLSFRSGTAKAVEIISCYDPESRQSGIPFFTSEADYTN